jgi:L,D-transpeptidase ErfK/SrfK
MLYKQAMILFILADMKISTRLGASVLLSLWLGGCASLSDWNQYGQPPWHTATPGDRFELPRDGGDVVGKLQVVTTDYEDTLLDIARRYDLGYDELVAANPDVDPWLPGQDTRVVLPTRFVLPGGEREGLVLNLASKRLFYFPEADAGQQAEVITHPIGIGREGWLTPQGTMHITHKMARPAWTVPESVRREHAEAGDPLPPIVPPGPDNPLGEFAMRLSSPTYLIHGTNQPYGVGQRVSHGCVRLYPEDIERLFPQVPVGTSVQIINEPYVAGWQDGLLYLEAHAPLEEEAKRWNGSLHAMEQAVTDKIEEASAAPDWDRARQIAREARGIPVPVPVATGEPESADAPAPAAMTVAEHEGGSPVPSQDQRITAKKQ